MQQETKPNITGLSFKQPHSTLHSWHLHSGTSTQTHQRYLSQPNALIILSLLVQYHIHVKCSLATLKATGRPSLIRRLTFSHVDDTKGCYTGRSSSSPVNVGVQQLHAARQQQPAPLRQALQAAQVHG